MAEEKKESSTKLHKTSHWDAWFGEVLAYSRKEGIDQYVLKPEPCEDDEWYKPKKPQGIDYRQELNRIATLPTVAEQARQEKLLDYDMDNMKDERKKYDRKIKSLNELGIWMKKSTARIHLGLLNQFGETYEIFEFLKRTYAPTEMDRIEETLKQRDWLVKCDYGKKGIEDWIYQWEDVDRRLTIQKDIMERYRLRTQFRQANSRIDPALGAAMIGMVNKSESEVSFQTLTKDALRHYQQNPPNRNDNRDQSHFATFNGNRQDGTKMSCLCGRDHIFNNCPYVNPDKRPKNFSEERGIREKFDTLITSSTDKRAKALKATLKKLGKTYDDTKSSNGNEELHMMTFKHDGSYIMQSPYKDEWLIDSCSDRHICNRLSRIRNMRNADGATMRAGDGLYRIVAYCEALVHVEHPSGKGTIDLWLSETAYIPDHPANLISTPMINDRGGFLDESIPGFKTRSNKVLFKIQPIRGRKFWRAERMDQENQHNFSSFEKGKREATTRMWHQALGHPGPEPLKHLQDGTAGGEVNDHKTPPDLCETCLPTKSKASISRAPRSERDDGVLLSSPYAVLHADLILPSCKSIKGHIAVYHDFCEVTKLHGVQCITSKSQFPICIKSRTARIERGFQCQVITIHTDQDPTLKEGTVFQAWLLETGRTWEPSPAYAPHMNGPIEVAGKILTQTARSLHIDSGLPLSFWNFFYETAGYLLNRRPTKALEWNSPLGKLYEFKGSTKKPYIGNLRVYGCQSWVHDRTLPKGQKMLPRAHEAWLIGYVASDIWRVWIPTLNAIRETGDVTFNENIQYKNRHDSQSKESLHVRFAPTVETDTEDSDKGDDSDSDNDILQPATGSDEHPLTPTSQSTHQSSLPTNTTPSSVQHPDRTQHQGGEIEEVTHDNIQHGDAGPDPSRIGDYESIVDNPMDIDEEPDLGVPQDNDQHDNYDNQLVPWNPTVDDDDPPPDSDGDIPMDDFPIDTTGTSGSYVDPITGNSAPRGNDVSGSLSERNILTNKRRPKQFDANLRIEEQVSYAFLTAELEHRQRHHQNELPPPPENWVEALRHPFSQKWIEAANEEMNSMESMNTWERIKTPSKTFVVPTTWSFAYKFDEDGYLTRYKARLCARGDLQRKYGRIDESRATTMAMRMFRFLMALAAAFDMEIHHLDVKNAYLNADIGNRNIFVGCAPGFRKSGTTYRLNKALYGLVEAAMLWQECLDKELTGMGFHRISEESCVYIRDGIIVFFYVDDLALLAAKEKREEFEKIKNDLKEIFEIHDQGELKWFMGVRVLRNRKLRKLWLVQDSYIDYIVRKFGCEHLPRAYTPITHIPRKNLSKIRATARQMLEYLSRIGSVIYPSVVTRPDIAFACSVLSSFSSNPSQEHFAMVQGLIIYLRDTKYLAIEYNGNVVHFEAEVNRILKASSDASFANDAETRRSTEGYLLQLFRGPIDWKAKKQPTVATSTTEAELLALTNAAKEIEAWNRVFEELNFDPEESSNTIECDNRQAIRLVTARHPVIKTGLRHVHINGLWLRQENLAGKVEVKWVPTEQMVSDGFTKPLPRQKFTQFVNNLGMVDIRDMVRKS